MPNKGCWFLSICEVYSLVGSDVLVQFCPNYVMIYNPYMICVEQTVDVLRHQWAYSCEKAKKELDYKPRSLRLGLSEMLPWLKNLGMIKY